jgi:hypothetical protein
MAGDFDAKLTALAAETLRDAVQVYDPNESERLLVGFNPVPSVWNTGTFSALDATGSFAAITGALPVLTGSLPALSSAGTGQTGTGDSARYKGLTGSFRAITSSFQALGQVQAKPPVSLKRVFKLPSKLPGIRLPAERELGAMARSAPIMSRLDGLARWLGREGRLVTDTDELGSHEAADAAQWLGIPARPLSFLWQYALTSGWFELTDSADQRRTWAVIGQSAWRWTEGDDRGALHVWATVFAAVAARALDVMADTDPEAARKLNFRGQGAALAVMLFLARRSGMTTRDVEDLVRDGAIGEQPTSRRKRAWDGWVRQHGHPAHHLLAELAELHALSLPRAAGETVKLTPLALWALREQFALDEVTVPVLPPPTPQMSAAHLVRLADAVSDAEFDAAFTAWMRGRDPDQAVRELLIYAGSSGPLGRLAAVDIARRIGPAGHRAWRDAMQRPELRGYARITLSTMAGNLPDSRLTALIEQNPEDMAWLAVDLLATACGAEDPDPDEVAEQFAEAVPTGEEAWIFQLMSQSRHPDVARVLDVLSSYHPDRRVAKDARRAARVMAKNRTPVGGHRVPARAGVR